MQRLKTVVLLGLMILLVAGLAGCGKKADESKAIADVEAEAEKMDVAKLKQMVLTYKDAIVAKKGEVEKIAAKVKDLGIAKAMSDEAKGLTADIDELNKSVSALKQRFEVYYNKLKEKGGDVSGLTL